MYCLVGRISASSFTLWQLRLVDWLPQPPSFYQVRIPAVYDFFSAGEGLMSFTCDSESTSILCCVDFSLFLYQLPSWYTSSSWPSNRSRYTNLMYEFHFGFSLNFIYYHNLFYFYSSLQFSSEKRRSGTSTSLAARLPWLIPVTWCHIDSHMLDVISLLRRNSNLTSLSQQSSYYCRRMARLCEHVQSSRRLTVTERWGILFQPHHRGFVCLELVGISSLFGQCMM